MAGLYTSNRRFEFRKSGLVCGVQFDRSLREPAFMALRSTMNSYFPISDPTWTSLREFCDFRQLEKHRFLYPAGVHPKSFSFVYSGLFRLFYADQDGSEYNKNFFDSGSFPGSMAALLKGEVSEYAIESLEDSSVITINFRRFRQLLLQADDLKMFQIYYLEKNWLLEKDARELQIVQEDAAQRYQRFLGRYPSIAARIPQYHIASHLGITPTQLSRVRKKG
ncbi:MAG: Crp/Fnr family transcriptional regulator [Kofleriaceae bacterium]|nr:Crp/Fnr family transcriptional regulator [Kofleriaceae bacterium]